MSLHRSYWKGGTFAQSQDGMARWKQILEWRGHSAGSVWKLEGTGLSVGLQEDDTLSLDVFTLEMFSGYMCIKVSS